MTKFQLPRFYAIGNSLLLTSLVLMSFMFDAFYVEIQAQNINPCGTPALTDIERDFLLNTVYNQPLARNAGTTCIPIKPHIVRETNGTGGSTLTSLNQGLANLNHHFLPAGIEFYYCGAAPNYIDDSSVKQTF